LRPRLSTSASASRPPVLPVKETLSVSAPASRSAVVRHAKAPPAKKTKHGHPKKH
jgi:hypothetical protein